MKVVFLLWVLDGSERAGRVWSTRIMKVEYGQWNLYCGVSQKLVCSSCL